MNKTHLKTKTNFFKEFFKQLSKFGEDVVIICQTACCRVPTIGKSREKVGNFIMAFPDREKVGKIAS